ncbi:MAG: prolyl oligopeptidase family protein [Gemmatimonadaceae bacterium]
MNIFTLRRAIALFAALTTLAATAAANSQSATEPPFRYPETRRADLTDTLHGTPVGDPYRWLEDTDTPETRAWIEAQNAITFGYLAGIPERPTIKDRLTAVWDYPKYGVPFKRGKQYFYFQNSGLQNQSVLYVQQGLDGAPRVLLDPNTLSADGTVALSALAVADDGRHLGYGLSASGSDWQEFRVRDVKTGTDLEDHLKWIKFSGIAWTKDGKGFFYSRYDEPKGGNTLLDVNRNQKLYYHRLGTPQSQDQLIYERPDHPDWGFGATVSEDGQYAVVSVSEGTDRRNRLYYIDLAAPQKPNVGAPIVKLLDAFDASYDFVGNTGPVFYVRTDNAAPRSRLIAVDINNRAARNWTTLIPQSADALENVSLVGERFVANYLHDARSVVRLYALNGASAGELSLPGIGTVGGLDGKRFDREMFYSFTSYLSPTTIYRYDFKRRSSEIFRQSKPPFDASKYETKQVFFKSKDGTRVPMFITARKGVTLDGNNPTLLYGYGGFNISLTPSYSPARLVWLEMGGIYAVPNLRGGGEYGEEWHKAGTLDRKQNVFDDFIAAAEFLISEKYTSPSKLAIQGGSNGGLLVGAAMTQRPELYAVALPAVGVMDMLRFHKFTIGWAWVSDYGSADDSSQFPALRRYSPLHNLKAGTKYPATLVTTADHDDRVVPGHSFKFAAALQAAHAGNTPVLIRIDTKAGHGGGKPTTKVIKQVADELAFAVKNLGMTVALTP